MQCIGGCMNWFATFSRHVERAVGHPIAFSVACAVIVAWAIAGPMFNYSDTWQLVINTATTIVTFLMVFLIQSTQSRDTAAIHLKLDELLRVSEGRNALISSEEMDREVLDRLLHELR